jgi:hypothetical protein
MRTLLCVWLALAGQTPTEPELTPPLPSPGVKGLTPEQRKRLNEMYPDAGTAKATREDERKIERQNAVDRATLFFKAIVDHQVQNIVAMITGPFYLEGKYFDSAEAAREAWTRILEARGDTDYRLQGLVVLTPAEMEARYGKPPERLAAIPWKRPNTYIAVANLSGKAAVLVLRMTPVVEPVAFTD